MANVAGIAHEAPVAEITEEDVDRVVAINLKGTLFGCQAAMRAMKESGGGSIINVASASIDIGAPNYGLYAMTKAAVAQLTMSLTWEAGRHGIRVNTIAPGATVTPFTARHAYEPDGTLNQAAYDEFVQRMRNISPLRQVGEAMDQVPAAVPGLRRLPVLHRSGVAGQRRAGHRPLRPTTVQSTARAHRRCAAGPRRRPLLGAPGGLECAGSADCRRRGSLVRACPGAGLTVGRCTRHESSAPVARSRLERSRVLPDMASSCGTRPRVTSAVGRRRSGHADDATPVGGRLATTPS